jgi:hypothetical protein
LRATLRKRKALNGGQTENSDGGSRVGTTMTEMETAVYPVWMIRRLYKAEDDLKAEVAALKKQIAELEQKQKLV